jgi:thiol-disulfide isomerase/thioredoxin
MVETPLKMKIPFLLLLLLPLVCLPVSLARAQDLGLLEADGRTAGVGIALGTADGFLIVSKIMPDSPAAASKQIHEGDRVLAVGEGEEPSVSLVGKTIVESVVLVRGAAGSRVRLTVVGQGAPDSAARDVILTRDELLNPLGLALDATLLMAGTKAPELRYVRVSDGKETSLAEAQQGRMVVVEFWATWCVPCQQAVTDLQKTAAAHAKQKDKVAFLTISVDGDSGTAKGADVLKKVATHVKEKGWTDTVTGWASIEGRKDWYIGAVPTTYVIGADGKIIAANPDPKTMSKLLASPSTP